MKTILRHFFITVAALWGTSQLLPGLSISGGWQGLFASSIAFMLINILVVPLLKILLLPLNILTLGFFTWASNILALYVLVSIVPHIKINSYQFPGVNMGGVNVDPMLLSSLVVVVLSSFSIGLISHFLYWLVK